jgi:hypothetical protein
MLFFSLAATLLLAQTTFKKRYGTSGNDRAWNVEVLPDNSFIVAGSSTGGGMGGEDAMLVKFSATGTVEWSKSYGGAGYDIFFRVYACSDGNFLAVGETNSMGGGGLDLYVVKFDINGNVLWESTCGGSNFDGFPRACEVSDGYIISGSTMSFGNGNLDIFVEKLDFNGNSVWSKAWGGNNSDTGGEPLLISNGDIWITGATGNDEILMRISPNGTFISATRNGAASEIESTLSLTSGGPGLIVSGSGLFAGQFQPLLLGFNSSGGLIWSKRYLLPAGSYEINAEDCPNGGLIFAPTSSFNDPNAYLVKTDDNGNITWAKSYTFNGTGRMSHARPAPDGGYVAVGYCSGAGLDFFILKTDADGHVAGCCPEDASITVESVTLPTSSTSPGTVNGPAGGNSAGQNEPVDLTEADLCNGNGCCDTYAGTMQGQTLHACINQPATFTHNGDDVLDGNDLLQFILFSDPNDTLGSIIAISNTPTFAFDPATMQTGVTYYVAAIAGNNVGGNVDFDDPCFDISNAAELIWHPLPEVVLQTDNNDVCPGGCRTLTAVLTGTPPFTLTVTSPAGTTTVTIQDNTGTFQICPPPGTPPGSFTVQAMMLTDAYCTCP